MNVLSKIPYNAKIALYGAGSFGLYFLDKIQCIRKDLNILCLVDDQKNGIYKDLKIVDLENLIENYTFDWLLISTSYWKQIIKNLQEKKIYNYIIADPGYQDQIKYENIEVNNHKISCYCPNEVLRIISDKFSLIEPDTLSWIDSFTKGSVFYDVGASNGIFTVYAAIASECNVVAFEPDAQNFAILEMNHYINKQKIISPIISLNIALSDSSKLSKLGSLSYSPGTHSKALYDSKTRGESPPQEFDHLQYVITEPLDTLISKYNLPEPQYIKIDVDNHEENVLIGATKTIQNQSLKEILVEMEENSPASERIRLFLENNRFTLYGKYSINEIFGSPISKIKNYLFKRH